MSSSDSGRLARHRSRAKQGDAPEVSPREELDRLLPLIQATRDRTDAVISAETYHSEVAREVLAAGADVINDVSGLHDLAEPHSR